MPGAGSVSGFAFMAAIIQIPASTTNFGPGFDCLGAALQLHNRVQVERITDSDEPGALPPIVRFAGKAFFRAAQMDYFEFRAKISGDVPSARAWVTPAAHPISSCGWVGSNIGTIVSTSAL